MTDNVRIQTVDDNEAVDEGYLTISINTTIDFGLTSSGKAINVASTEGWYPIPGHPDLALNLNLIRKKGGGAWRQK